MNLAWAEKLMAATTEKPRTKKGHNNGGCKPKLDSDGMRELIRLRDSGLSWLKVGKAVGVNETTARRNYNERAGV